MAFVRGGTVVTVIQRLPLVLKNDWGDTVLDLPPGRWRNVLGDSQTWEKTASLAKLLRTFPVALLTRKESE